MKTICHSLLGIAALATSLCSHNARAERSPTPWQVRKCEIYRQAWNDLPKLVDTTAFTDRFEAVNADFMASGCLASTGICPGNEAELKAANLLTIASMNGGTASTFPPFRC